MPERKNVVIKSAISERPFEYKGKQYTDYEFKAQVDGDDEPVKFKTTSKELAGIIAKEGIGSKVELEYEISVRGDFTNRKVSQVYKDGVGLATPKTSSTSGYKGYGKSSSKDSEVESSKRCALMQASELYRHCTEAGTPFDDSLYRKMYKVNTDLLGLENPVVAEAKKLGAVEK